MEFHDDKQSTHKRHINYSRALKSGTDSDSCAVRQEKALRIYNKDLLVVCLVEYFFLEPRNYRTYRLVDRSSHYDDEAAWSDFKWAKVIQEQTRSPTFDSLDPISILSFLSAFEVESDTNGVEVVATLELLQTLLEVPLFPSSMHP